MGFIIEGLDEQANTCFEHFDYLLPNNLDALMLQGTTLVNISSIGKIKDIRYLDLAEIHSDISTICAMLTQNNALYVRSVQHQSTDGLYDLVILSFVLLQQ